MVSGLARISWQSAEDIGGWGANHAFGRWVLIGLTLAVAWGRLKRWPAGYETVRLVFVCLGLMLAAVTLVALFGGYWVILITTGWLIYKAMTDPTNAYQIGKIEAGVAIVIFFTIFFHFGGSAAHWLGLVG